MLGQALVCPVTIGRAAELDALSRALQAASDGSGQTIMLAGEAGVGKTRLVREAMSLAGQVGFLALQGQCFEPDRTLPTRHADAVQPDLRGAAVTEFPAGVPHLRLGHPGEQVEKLAYVKG